MSSLMSQYNLEAMEEGVHSWVKISAPLGVYETIHPSQTGTNR
jgi:hypothetical protein